MMAINGHSKKHPNGDHYRQQTSGEGIETAFGDGMRRDQGMKGSRQANGRASRMDAMGSVKQPVKRGTNARRHAPFKGDRI